MADDMSFRQRAVIEFLVKEEIPAAGIQFVQLNTGASQLHNKTETR